MVIVGFLGMVVFGLLIVAYIVWIMNVGMFGPREKRSTESTSHYDIGNQYTPPATPCNEAYDPIKSGLQGAKVLIKLGKYVEAINCLELMVSNYGGNFSLYFNLGECYECMEDYDNAVVYFKKCLEIEKSTIVSRRLGNIYFRANDFARAKLYYEKSSKSGEVYYLLGLCYLGLGELNNAEAIVDKVRNKEYRAKLIDVISRFKQQSGMGAGQTDLKRFYTVLDLPIGASKNEIKQAYRELVKVWHPDRFNHDPKLQTKAEQKMKAINEAYENLCRI